MPHMLRTFVTAALVAFSLPTRAYACGGPCTTPELWGVLPLGETPLVVANFGLLRPEGSGWQLTCEETIGDILLGVKSNSELAVVSTESGLFVGGGDLCAFTPGPTSERSDWFLDFAVAADSSADSPHLLALASDPVASVINLELAQGGNFQILHTLGSETAYRRVAASPDFSTIVVAGYSSQPRQWQLAWSPDSGETWQEFIPELDVPSASVALLGLDPTQPNRLFFQIEGTDEIEAQLWTFDRESGRAERQLSLGLGTAITGLDFVGEEVWLANKAPSGGGLLHASLTDLTSFTPVLNDVPPLACLGVVDGVAHVCVDDYSLDSPFLLGKVNIAEERFEPLMVLDDLGHLTTCGAACDATLEWLETVYGTSERPDAGNDTSEPAETTEPTTQSPRPPKDDGGCSAIPGSGRGYAWLSLLGLALSLVRRRRA